jgi:DnaJ-domain-containing protein 1
MVAPSDEIPGLGPKTDRPRLNTAADLTRLKLTPTEGFVLSRIDGRASYDEICRMSSLGREETLAILRKLRRAAIILGPKDVVVAPTPGRKTTRSVKSPSPDRSHRTTPPPMMVTDAMLRQAQERTDGKPEPAAKEPGSVLERLDDGEPVPPAELIDGHDLPVETKRRIFRLYRRLRKLAPHELLGVPEDADKAAVKRAFAAASKELHPDRYFGKDLGSFREKLAKIFARVTEAVQELEKARKGK